MAGGLPDFYDQTGGGSGSPLETRPLYGGNIGFLPSGGSGVSTPQSSGGGGFGADVTGAITGAVPLLLSLFGPGNSNQALAENLTGSLAKTGASLGAQGLQTSSTGNAALAPVLQYLRAVVGGDPTALNEATQPEQKRVIDQYDTAKKALAFLPRGGGQASAVLNLEGKKASDLSNVVASARAAGVKDLGSLGEMLLNTGNQQQAQGANETATAAQLAGKLGEDTTKSQAGLGSSIGSAIAGFAPMLLSFFSHSALKDHIDPVDSAAILRKLAHLRVQRWRYRGDDVDHIGPFAEEFHELFHVGDGVTLNVADIMGVLIAAQKAQAELALKGTTAPAMSDPHA